MIVFDSMSERAVRNPGKNILLKYLKNDSNTHPKEQNYNYTYLLQNGKINNIVREKKYDSRISYKGNGKTMINSTRYW